MKKFILLLLFFFFIKSFLFSQTPNTLIRRVCDRFNEVKNFRSDVDIDFDIPSINMQKMSGKVLYKAPKKFRVRLTGIAFLPKQNPFELYDLLKDSASYVAVSNGREMTGGVNCFIVSVIPSKDQDVILAKCWINPIQNTILKSQITTKSSGTLTSEYFFQSKLKYALPDKIVFTIDLNKFKLPKMISVDINSKKTNNTNPSRTTGTITFNLSQYQVNMGVKDEEFLAK